MEACFIAPAPAHDWKLYEKNITIRNTDGTPSEGTIAVNYGVYHDLRTLTLGNFHENIFNASNEEGMTMSKVKPLKDIYELLKPGLIVALKRGMRVFAWAEITSPYYYSPDTVYIQKTGKEWAHRWDYKILRMANNDESVIRQGYRYAFYHNCIQVPEDVKKIQEQNKLRQKIMEKREEKTLLYNKMQEAIEAFRASEDEINSLEITLELSGVI